MKIKGHFSGVKKKRKIENILLTLTWKYYFYLVWNYCSELCNLVLFD